MNEKIAKILENEEVVMMLDSAPDETVFCSILAEHGAAADDINEFIEHLCSIHSEDELSEAELESVAGGAPVLQKALAKWAYRFKHKKIFVKASAKDGVITVTNRFGDKVTETYYY